MTQNCNVLERSDEVQRRLNELALDAKTLREAILDGEAARESCTDHDPVQLPGLLAWARVVRGLRNRLVESGWMASDTNGYATVVSPDGSIAIAVATGNDLTGSASAGVSTKYPKGAATVTAVQCNQLELFSSNDPAADTPTTVTWLLLIHRERDGIQAELSRPELIDLEGFVVRWSERIILQPISLEPEPKVDPDDSEDEIEITITRRTTV